MLYNQNAGYGRALLNAVHANVPTFGNIFVVFDPDDYDEANYQKMQELFLSDPEGRIRFYTDITLAEDAAESNNNDVIVLDNNSSHVLTTFITNDKNRLHYISLDYLMGMRRRQGQGAKITIAGSTATNTSTIRNTGVRGSFRGIKFDSSNTSTSALWAFEEGGEFTYFDNCHFVRSAIVSTATAADLLMNGDSSEFHKCTFGITSLAITANGDRPCVDLGREQITGKVCRDGVFEDCLFQRRSSDADNSFIYSSAATDVERMLLINKPIFWADALSTTNMAECVSGAATLTTGSILVIDPAATQTPAAISTTTGVFVEGYTPDATGAAAGIAIQCA